MTEHFDDAELACACGCGLLPPQSFQDQLEKLRVEWGRPLRVSSGARCAKHNQEVSTTGPRGPHVRGAVDLVVLGDQVWRFVELAQRLGWTGIGLCCHGSQSGRFVHLDRLPERSPGGRIWTYQRSSGSIGQ